MKDNTENRSNLKIAILVRMFPNIVQTYVLNHILSLKSAGVRTLIVAERDPRQDETHPKVLKNKLIDKTLYINTSFNKKINQHFIARRSIPRYLSAVTRLLFSNLGLKRGFKYWFKSLLRARVLGVRDIDIAHSHSLFSSYDYLFLKDVFSIRLITTFHGLVPKNVKMLEPKKIQAVLESGDLFFVNTVFAQKQLIGLGCSETKIHILPQGTDTDDFPFIDRQISEDKPVILLSVGRLSIEKGFHIAIKAVGKLVKQHPNIEYHIIGGGPEKNNLRDLINELGLQSNVKLIGSTTTDALLSHYQQAHVFILPSIDFQDGSHTETQGVVLQEAQSSGIPVIASSTGGIPEVIKDNETGLLFEEKNHTQLANKIRELLVDPLLYQSLCINARKDVEESFSTTAIYNQMMNIYDQLLYTDK